MCKSTKRSPGAVSSLSHIIAFGRFVDLREEKDKQPKNKSIRNNVKMFLHNRKTSQPQSDSKEASMHYTNTKIKPDIELTDLN